MATKAHNSHLSKCVRLEIDAITRGVDAVALVKIDHDSSGAKPLAGQKVQMQLVVWEAEAQL